MFYNRMKKLPFVMLTLLVLAACNNNSSIAPSSSSSRPSTSITTSSSNVTSSSSDSSSTSSVSSSSSNVTSLSSSSSSTSSVSSSSTSVSSSSSEVPNDERYAIYVKAQSAGFTGTYQEWLDSIKGADGTSLLNGTSNPTSSQGKNGDTYINTSTWDVFVKSGGNWTKVGNVMGPKGDKGDQGVPGQDGEDGLSSYEIYKKYYPGYLGTEFDWINDLALGQLVKTVTYNFNGGETTSAKTNFFKGEVIGNLPTTTRNYYNFSGWYIGQNSINSTYYVIDDVTITAGWIIQEGAILTAEHLSAIRNNLSGTYFLANDIDLLGNEWTPIGTGDTPFSGIFDGNGFKIKNLTIAQSQEYVGLFANNSGTIRNLDLENVQINVQGSISSFIYAGALVANNTGIIENIESLDGTLFARARGVNQGFVGGIIGLNNINTTLGGLTNNINVSGENTTSMGGIIGRTHSTITINNSTNNGSVSGNSQVGGLIGGATRISVSVTNSLNSGSVTGGSQVGGLVGFLEGPEGPNGQSFQTIANSMNNGIINGSTQVGGLIGASNNLITIIESINAGSVGGSEGVGGLIGRMPNGASIMNSINTAVVSGTSRVGGLFGTGYTITITNSYNSGDVVGTLNFIGGLIGYGVSTVTNSLNSGIVSGTNSVGGLIGYGVSPLTTITNSLNTGNVNGTYQVGGLIGQESFQLFVYYSVNVGNVLATNTTSEIGGISGNIPAIKDLEEAYHYGSITSNGVEVAGTNFGNKVTDISTFNLALFTTTLGWDTEVWDFTGLDIANGVYPTLKNMPEIPLED